MVVDPYVLDSSKTPSEFEAMVRSDLESLLSERHYLTYEIQGLLTAFDTAADIHRRKDERRKVPKPFWEGAAGGEPYMGHIGRVLRFMLIEPAFNYKLDPKTLAVACLHDTLETLIDKEPEQFRSRDLAFGFVMGNLSSNLQNRGLAECLPALPDIQKITYSLSRNHDDVYYKSIGQIFSNEPDNIMRALIVKGFDRIDNGIDLQDLSKYSGHWKNRNWQEILNDMKKTLKSYFKTLVVANEIKRYIVEKNPLDSPLSSNLRQMPRIISMNMKLVYDIISGTLKEYAGTLPKRDGSELLEQIEKAKQEMDEYELRGGFNWVTSDGELGSEYDGTIRRYDDFLRNKANWHTYNPSPLKIYRDARSIQTLLYRLYRKDLPDREDLPELKDYYLHGFEWENFSSRP